MSKIKKGFLALSSMVYLSSAWSFTCYLTAIKDSCWGDYDVTIQVEDTLTTKIVGSVVIPKGQYWKRESFTCSPRQTFQYVAQFSPAFWQNSVGKKYTTKRTVTLPDAIPSFGEAWTLSTCYMKDYANVPLPPQATGACVCNTKYIPAMPRQMTPAQAEKEAQVIQDAKGKH